MLPARFDDTPLPGLLSDMVAVDLRGRTPQEFADLVVKKLAGLGVIAPISSANARSAGPRPTGRISSPQDGGKVRHHQVVSSIVTNLPPDAEAWIVVLPTVEGTYWPQYNLPKGYSGDFQKEAWFGGEKRRQYTGAEYTVEPVMAPPDASARFREFRGKDSSRGMLKLPDGVELRDQVTVKRR